MDRNRMTASLRDESERLARSWMRHDPALLRDYLVSGVEDPRINVQSILTRHFLVRAVHGNRFERLMIEEIRFAAAMGWIHGLARQGPAGEVSALVLHALRRRADNVEGIAIPPHVSRIFAALPSSAGGVIIPHYIENTLAMPEDRDSVTRTFALLWSQVLRRASAGSAEAGIRVLEPACGSANDYRCLREYGLTAFLDYTGIDICSANIANARALFPDGRFETGNVFELAAPTGSFRLCFVHDLFEHLSLEGLEAAAREIGRVTSEAACVGFFNMRDIAGHVINPVEDYHWNTLSVVRMRELFAAQGFGAEAVHIGSLLRERLGCGQTHNENAWTFLLTRSR
jgi:SAM-dependent methyltransferase